MIITQELHHILGARVFVKNSVKQVFQILRYAGFLIKNRRPTRPTLYVLTYHRTLPKGDSRREYEQPGMMIAPELIAKHAEWMKRLGAIPISLERWTKEKDSLPANIYFAVTFDDGWRDNAEFAIPLLTKEKIFSTIFLVADYIEHDTLFWPEKLIYLLKRTFKEAPSAFDQAQFKWLKDLGATLNWSAPPDIEQLDPVINLCKAIDDRTLNNLIDKAALETFGGEADTSKTRNLLGQKDIATLLDEGGVDFGSHTCRHLRLDKIESDDELEYEIAESRQKIAQSTGKQPKFFCYPNGNTSEKGVQVVAQNYNAACTTKQGANTPDTPLMQLRRHNLHDGNASSKISFFATLSNG
ncbi:polysaccharide deacetylase family protein [Hahella sp. KA22]|uniref:polysaccharide deacetylase family protein n=1 Tax=Hahella sp. KA22 TaxID=1628392 RepID=UPI000FDDE981|nr:polysaccharide deacetylase family protein [Hahella sp. KA22]AZZ92983.1 polysaccharide deacetylase family protein [Hahella sp. KA22]QAY56357.1 polysaccharide deacetylase family protein [Hahella sp. KA22]